MVFRTGKNLQLEKKGSFRKIVPKLFDDQLGVIYYQYEFLNPTKNRYQIKVPDKLISIRNEIDKNYHKF
jgi:hypothetical protein